MGGITTCHKKLFNFSIMDEAINKLGVEIYFFDFLMVSFIYRVKCL